MIKITIISAPLRVPKSSKKDFILNINNYRNAYYHTLNKTKITYKAILENQIKQMAPATKIAVTYVVYADSRRKFDLMNVVSIHSKYFLDALVEFGKIPDDSFNHVIKESTAYGGVDKHNPRVEILIEDFSDA